MEGLWKGDGGHNNRTKEINSQYTSMALISRTRTDTTTVAECGRNSADAPERRQRQSVEQKQQIVDPVAVTAMLSDSARCEHHGTNERADAEI